MEALSSRPLQYQWYFIGVPIAHGTQPTLTVATDSQFRGGGYYVIVSDGIDAVQSRIVMGLTQTFPIVTQQPESVRAREGSTVTFTVAAIAKGPLSYRWEGSVPLPPGTITSDPTLTLTNISQADAGRYWAWLADAEGQGSSIGAELSILPEIISTNPSYQAALAAGTNAYSTIGYGPALTVLLSHPNGSSVAPNGDVYFANTGDHRIKKLTSGQQVVDVAGVGVGGYLDGSTLVSRFQDPLGICVDDHGSVYVADAGNHRLRRITPDGQVFTVAGSGVAGGADGLGAAAQFNYPNDVAIAPDGTILVSEFLGHRIRRVTTNGLVTTLVGTGTAGRRDGPAASALLDRPGGVATDGAGNVYFTEWGSHSLRRWGTNGVVTTLAGTGALGYVDGPGATVRLHNPDGIVVSPAGDVFFTDRENHAVRRLTPAGLVETVLGDGLRGTHLGTVATVRLNLPSGLALAKDGSLYVADTANRRLLHLTPETGSPTLLTQPADVVATRGHPITLKVDAIGVGPLSFQWSKDAQSLPEQTNPTLSLGPLTLADSGGYSVTVRDQRGATRSREARVTVTESAGPIILRQPQSVAVLPGGTAVFTVEATGTGTLEYQWQRHGAIDMPGERGPTLTISNTSWSSAIPYGVLIRDSVGSIRSEAARLSLIPTPAPVLVSSPSNAFVRASTSAHFAVDARGTGPLRYSWWARLPTFSEPWLIHDSMEPNWIVPGNSVREGTYWVSVKDLANQGVTTPEFTITRVPDVGPYVTVQPPERTTVPWGDSVRIGVTAEGSEPILYQWNRGTLPVAGATAPELVVPRVTTATRGPYTVKVSDRFGNTSESKTSQVDYDATFVPAFMISPSHSQAELGSTLTLACEAICSTTFKYQWFHNDAPVPGANRATLVINSMTLANLGSYWVKADANWASATSQVAYLDLPHVIQPTTPAQTVSTFAGRPRPGDIGGGGTNAALHFPTGFAVDPSGLLLFADSGNHRIKQIDAAGYVQRFSGRGNEGSADGSRFFAQYLGPRGIASVPSSGVLLVADTGNHLLRSMTPDGEVRTIAGILGADDHLDGPVASAHVGKPLRLAQAPDGSIYFTSEGAPILRRLTTSGMIETFAGASVEGGVDGPRLEARFAGIAGLVIDGSGNIVLTESRGHHIRRIDAEGQVTTLAGSPHAVTATESQRLYRLHP